MSLPENIDLVRELVAVPSVSSPDADHDQPNRGVIDRLAEWAEHVGFRVDVVPLSQDSNKANLIATMGDGPSGLVLSGHSDTVPFDEGEWDTDPFELVATDEGKLFGLGSADMKGFFGAALHAAQQFKAGQLKNPLVLLATADEESTMNGARDLVAQHRPTASFGVIGEPTGLTPVRAHKGIIMEMMRLVGRSGHSSNPALGESALEGMHRAITSLLEERVAIQNEFRDDSFLVPVPTINLGKIAGGDSPNRICPSCSLSYDVRVLPSMDSAATRDRLRAAVRDSIGNAELRLEIDDLVQMVPAFETPADARLVKALEAETGKRAESVMFCTEAPFLSQLGIETVVCGPGSIDVAHQPNEYTSRDQLGRATELYAKLIQRFCVDGDD